MSEVDDNKQDPCLHETTGDEEEGKQLQTSNTNKRSASCSISDAAIKRARVMMTSPTSSNAVHVLNVLAPGVQFGQFDQKGPCHSPIYSTKVTINGLVFTGTGTNKKRAKLAAAEKALGALLSEPSAETAAVSEVLPDESVTDNECQIVTPKVSDPVGTSPVAILNDIRPCTEYFSIVDLEQESNVGAAAIFKMGVVIDGTRFEGVGTSKKMARFLAAEAGLQKMFGLEFSRTSDGIPVFVGDESHWTHLKKVNKKSQKDSVVSKVHLAGGKHPMQLINELYPDAVFSVSEKPSTGTDDVYSVSIRINDTDFVGSGSNKKIARLNAAVEAVNAFKRDGTLERRLAEKQLHKMTKPKWQKPQRAAFLQKNEKQTGQAKGPTTLPKDAVVRLKEMFGNVSYEVMSKSPTTDVDGNPATRYFVLAMVLGQTFGGEGLTEEKAQLEASEAAMSSLGLWTEEDEDKKKEAGRVEAEQRRWTQMLYGKSRSKQRSKATRDWRLQGKSWVSGGKLESLPLILPDMSNSDAYHDFDGRHVRSWYGDDGLCSVDMQPQTQFDKGAENDFEIYPESYDTAYVNNYKAWQKSQEAADQDFYNDNGNFSGNDFGLYKQW